MPLTQHRISPASIEKLANSFATNNVTFPVANALLNVALNIDGINRIIGSLSGSVSRDNFYQHGKSHLFTPLEVDVIFRMVGANQVVGASVDAFKDLEAKLLESRQKPTSTDKSVASQSFEAVYNFTLGAIAGAIGATFVYPIGI